MGSYYLGPSGSSGGPRRGSDASEDDKTAVILSVVSLCFLSRPASRGTSSLICQQRTGLLNSVVTYEQVATRGSVAVAHISETIWSSQVADGTCFHCSSGWQLGFPSNQQHASLWKVKTKHEFVVLLLCHHPCWRAWASVFLQTEIRGGKKKCGSLWRNSVVLLWVLSPSTTKYTVTSNGAQYHSSSP